MRIDLHVHTTASSCSAFTPLQLVHGARSEEAAVVVTTNHGDSLGDSDYLREELGKHGILYFPAMEITTEWGDFLLFSEHLDEFQHIMRFPVVSLPDPAVAVIWAHPFEFFTEEHVHEIKYDVAPYIDAIEAINGKCLRSPWMNQMAMDLSRELEKPMTAGSDAHSAKNFFLVWTEFPTPIETYADFVKALKQGSFSIPREARGSGKSFGRE
ncbi:MAG: PHP domain-containing protein [Candidatus Eremiobacteraeota bacterium]|nr:PHP domain-containing protein [Candidatus Eremiobacteraeota bacterium]